MMSTQKAKRSAKDSGDALDDSTAANSADQCISTTWRESDDDWDVKTQILEQLKRVQNGVTSVKLRRSGDAGVALLLACKLFNRIVELDLRRELQLLR